MLRLRRYIISLLVALLTVPMGMASVARDDEDKDPSIRPGIRRLHPERERAKLVKKLLEQRARKADPNADPWDTSDDAWGTVDLPPLTSPDGNAVEGRRLNSLPRTSKTPAEQAHVDSLLAGDYSIQEYGYRRMTWRDLPVTTTIDQLLPGFKSDETGDCYSRYVSRDKTSNEVYLVFDLNEDSVPGPLRLCVQYCGASPLNYDQVIFHIDGFDYIFYPAEPKQGVTASGQRWERSDDVLHPAYKDLVYALAHSHWVVLKLVGYNGISNAKVLTDGQRDDFANVLALYRLLGGEL